MSVNESQDQLSNCPVGPLQRGRLTVLTKGGMNTKLHTITIAAGPSDSALHDRSRR